MKMLVNPSEVEGSRRCNLYQGNAEPIASSAHAFVRWRNALTPTVRSFERATPPQDDGCAVTQSLRIRRLQAALRDQIHREASQPMSTFVMFAGHCSETGTTMRFSSRR